MRRFIVAMMVVVAGCVVLPTSASAQTDMSRALGALLGQMAAESAATEQPDPYAVLRENAPQQSKITGIWLYDSVGFEYLGTNPLASVALTQLEGYALAELRGAGVYPGFYGLTLRRNGVAYLSYGDDIFDGRYEYNSHDASLVVHAKVDNRDMSLRGYLRYDGDRLVVMLDANDAMDMFLRMYPQYSTNQTVISANTALKSFGDVYVAVKHRR